MISGALPKVTLSRPPMPGPERAASSSVALPISAAVGMTPMAETKKIATAVALATSSTIASGMNGTRRYGHPSPLSRKRTQGLAGYGRWTSHLLPSARGAAGGSCASASRSTTSACWPCCGRTSASPPCSPRTPTARAKPTASSAARSQGLPRDDYALVGAIGHDFYAGEREGAKGFPRFTDPRLRGPDEYGAYLRMAAERACSAAASTPSTCSCSTTPTAPATQRGGVGAMAELRAAGLARSDRRGPRPGQRLHARPHRLPRAPRRPDRLGDDHPQPARALARRARARRGRRPRRAHDHPRRRLRGAVLGRRAPRPRLRRARPPAFRPAGWIEEGRARLDRLRPIAARHDLSPLQLAVQWNLAHPTVACVVPTLIQEPGPGARRARTSAPSSPPRRTRSCSTPTRSRRSAPSATTPAAWRSRAAPRSTRAHRPPIGGRWTLSWKRWRRAGGSTRTRQLTLTRR